MTRIVFFAGSTESQAYLEGDSTNSYPRNQLKQEKRDVQINFKISPAFIYMKRGK